MLSKKLFYLKTTAVELVVICNKLLFICHILVIFKAQQYNNTIIIVKTQLKLNLVALYLETIL